MLTKYQRMLLIRSLIIAILITIVPAGRAAASDITLDISAGSIAIYDTGYKQPATAVSITPYTSGYILTGTSTTNNVTVVSGTRTIYLDGLSINVSAIASTPAFDIQGTSAVTLILNDGKSNSFRSGNGCAGIQVAIGASLNIATTLQPIGNGTLTAVGLGDGAGIGGAYNGPGGVIRISGGTITATGGWGAAGVGSGYNADGCSITITGGSVTANSTGGAAAVGTGRYGDNGIITISGGTVSATASGNGAGIGTGEGGYDVNISISNGTVTGTSNGDDAPGIGSYYFTASTIDLSGGSVTATGGRYAAAIGSGYGSGGGTINISGGTITGNGVYRGAGIGDYSGEGTVINMSGGTVYSYGGTYAAGFGKGYYDLSRGASPVFNFNGGTLTAKRGSSPDYAYDANILVKTTAGLASSTGGTFKLAAGQTQFKISGEVTGIFSLNKNGNVIASGGSPVVTTTASANGYMRLSPTESGVALPRQTDNLAWKYLADTTAAVLSSGSATRTSNSAATITFSTDEAGSYYQGIVDSGAGEPSIDTSSSGTAVTPTSNTISLTSLTAGAKDVYLKLKDFAGNVSSSLRIAVASYDTMAPTLTAGATTRTSDTAGTAKFTSNEAGTYYYAVVASGAGEPAIDTSGPGTAALASENTISLTTLTAGAKDVYVKVKDAAGNVSSAVRLAVPIYDVTAPTLTAGVTTRATISTGTAKFTTNEAGSYYYSVVASGSAEPAINTTGAGTSAIAGENTINLSGIGSGAQDVYVKVKDGAGNASSALRLTVAAYDLTAPVLTASSTARPTTSSGSVTFNSNEAGTYYYASVAGGAAEPSVDTSSGGTAMVVGQNTISFSSLTTGPKDVYVKGKDANGNVSASLKLTVPVYDLTVPETVDRSSGGSAPVNIPAPAVVPDVTSTGDKNQNVSTTVAGSSLSAGTDATITSNHAAEIIRKAEAAGGSSKRVEISVTPSATTNPSILSVPASIFGRLVDTNVATLTAKLPNAEISLDSRAMDRLRSLTGGAGSVSITVTLMSGDRPAHRIAIARNETAVTELGSGRMQVRLPYQMAASANPDTVVAYRADGGESIIPGSRYVDGKVAFSTGKPGSYGVKQSSISFSDVPPSAWFNRAVTYMASREVLRGTGNGQFAPDANVSRADFLVMVMRTYSIEPDPTATANFADAGNKYYTPYLATAKAMGIVSGTGDNQYLPDAQITREQMFVMLHNMLKATDNLPAAGDAKQATISDAQQVAPWAREATQVLVNAGVVQGSNGMISPQSLSTRGQAAQVLFRLISQ